MRISSVYKGHPGKPGFTCVTANGRVLNPRRSVRDHSPTGFSWGYEGSGPAQLALAIMCHFLGNVEEAQSVYQDFKVEVIAKLPQDTAWELTGKQVSEAACVRHLVVKSVIET